VNKSLEAILASIFDSAAASTVYRFGTGSAVATASDLVYLPEFQIQMDLRLLSRAFTPAEIAEHRVRLDTATAFGLRWTAKEAACKALWRLAEAFGSPPEGLAVFRDYEVTNLEGPANPRLRFHGRPAAFLDERRAAGAEVNLSLSVTRDGDYAAAFVVIAVLAER
jgi:phosphopantetheine--protein transferase-like protein